MENKRIKIAMILGYMDAGGIEAVIMNYYRNLPQEKFQVDFFVLDGSPCLHRSLVEERQDKIYFLPRFNRFIKYVKILTALLRRGEYDIAHVNVNTLSVFGLLAAKNAKIPVRILHNHSTWGRGEWKRNIGKAILRPTSRWFATDYCACSYLAAEWMYGKKLTNSGEVIVWNNAIDTERFGYNREMREEMRRKLKLENRFVIGHVGRFMHQKNHMFLLKVFREVLRRQPNAVLLLIGEGVLMPKVKRRAEEMGIYRSVRFLGLQDRVEDYYQAMDCFLLPSLYEGLPVVGVEAQAAGLPCLFSTKVTDEVHLTTLASFMDLRESPFTWATALLAMQNRPREHALEQMRKAGFDIHDQAFLLEQYYERKVSR